jgi:H+/Cl- antiporter ClcA
LFLSRCANAIPVERRRLQYPRVNAVDPHHTRPLIAGTLRRWAVISAVAGLLSGVAGAAFLRLLDQATRVRWQFPWLLWFLPLAGVAMIYAYRRWGNGSERGNNLVIDAVINPPGTVPAAMAPLVFGGTLLTHLCGGSAGREGTAVQMGASLAASFLRRFGIGAEAWKDLLSAGIAGGFGAVFGTPLAGALFAIELPVIGRFQWRQAVPSVASAFIAHRVCMACGAAHTHYSIHSALPGFSPGWLWKLLLAGLVFGLCARLFAGMLHGLLTLLGRFVQSWWVKPVVAAAAVMAVTFALGTDAYLGLGVVGRLPEHPSIVRAFEPGGVTQWSWFWKIAFTAITLAGGFKGGEVTPLFFIGAAAGNTLAAMAGWPVDLFAALGFAAVFAGASHTPLACAVLGCEIFGSEYAVPFLVVCAVAHLVTTGTGIYPAQRIPVRGSMVTLGDLMRRLHGF